MQDLAVIEEPATASAVLDPTRARILAAFVEPGSATTLAKTLRLSRQKVNYHVRTLEGHGLVHLDEERQRRGLTERVMVASARSYVLSPAALGDKAVDPADTERFSARYLIALASRIARELAELARNADRVDKVLPTLAIDTEIRFASATDRAEFAADLTGAVMSLVAKYHKEQAPNGRWHRLVVAAYPRPFSTHAGKY